MKKVNIKNNPKEMENDNIIGTCLTMCPESEIKLRKREKLLHRLEISKTNEDRKWPVKEFCRSAAGQDMLDVKRLRPAPVLVHTVRYLLEDCIKSTEMPWYKVCDFITDRLRSVRQDMVIQRLSKPYCIAILQPIVKFHAYASYRLGYPGNIAFFDSDLNNRHLNECLKMLLNLYDELEFDNENCPDKVTAKFKLDSQIVEYDFDVNYKETRPFMEALYLIVHLGHYDTYSRYLKLPKKFRTKLVERAFKIAQSYTFGNWIRMIGYSAEFPDLLAGIFSQHLPAIRRKAFEVMSSAYNNKNLTFPAENLQRILIYENLDYLFRDLIYYGISVDQNKRRIQFLKSNYDSRIKTVPARKEAFADKKFKNIDISVAILYGK